jgi:hypothetical protein
MEDVCPIEFIVKDYDMISIGDDYIGKVFVPWEKMIEE